MRWYLSFGYGFKELKAGISFGDEEKSDLVGYGYDHAPILRSFKLNLLFIEIVIGNLIIVIP